MKPSKQLQIGLFATVSFLFLLMACQTSTSSSDNASGQGEPDSAPSMANEPAMPTTTIEFEEWTFDFDTIDAGEKVKFVYKFTNTGSEPLVIDKINLHCACMDHRVSREPVPPGGTGELSLQFDAKYKKGKQTKRATVFANTEPRRSVLQITGYVRAGPDRLGKN
ncbi:MAG: DUF1573 domain-containing protein [Bacteroidota bacterium]